MNLAEYFEHNRPRPRYSFGDRVEGRYQGTPYVGTAYGDNMVNELEGARVSIHLDLPMRLATGWVSYIRVSYNDIKAIRS